MDAAAEVGYSREDAEDEQPNAKRIVDRSDQAERASRV